MINVSVRKNDHQILDVKVSGHADSAAHGKDLVCAGVSTACLGIANALVEKGFLQDKYGCLVVENGYFHVEVFVVEKETQVILETLVTILATVEDAYGDYIKIIKMEV